MYLTNATVENFHSGVKTGAAGAVTISHASVILNYGTSGTVLVWTGALNTSRTLVAGDPIQLPAGALDINFPPGNAGVQDAAILAAWNALLADKTGGATVLLGTGAMGNAGTSNEVADGNYARQVAALTRATGTAPTA